ncbi:hypothetical protein H5410_003626 [Solanum commersonii]|uniref:Uncharacterized protein n=1 Tax=Solanum commersonii TaxID=4109 RepID=A0A9J6B564_SOLCO|nr:hypothetical protein H5410_003626 [Solanum commersonii]
MTHQEKRGRQDRDDDECMEKIIESIRRDGDLSLRKINELRRSKKRRKDSNTITNQYKEQERVNIYKAVRTQKSFERLMDLHKRNQYSYIAILELFQSPSELQKYRLKLGLPKAKVSSSAKIWIFWDDEWEKQEHIDIG